MAETLRQNHVYAGMNMFMPDAITISPGTTLRWSNESNVPYSVVGTYKTECGQATAIDSGFLVITSPGSTPLITKAFSSIAAPFTLRK
jgi:plastocyanin